MNSLHSLGSAAVDREPGLPDRFDFCDSRGGAGFAEARGFLVSELGVGREGDFLCGTAHAWILAERFPRVNAIELSASDRCATDPDLEPASWGERSRPRKARRPRVMVSVAHPDDEERVLVPGVKPRIRRAHQSGTQQELGLGRRRCSARPVSARGRECGMYYRHAQAFTRGVARPKSLWHGNADDERGVPRA